MMNTSVSLNTKAKYRVAEPGLEEKFNTDNKTKNIVKVYKISAITLSIENMEKSCKFYSRIPGFKIVYGGSIDDTFTTFKIGEDITMYLPR